MASQQDWKKPLNPTPMTKPTWRRGEDDDTVTRILMPEDPPEHELEFLAGCAGRERVTSLKRTYFQAFDAATAQDAALSKSAPGYDHDLPQNPASVSKKRKDSLQDDRKRSEGGKDRALSTPKSPVPAQTSAEPKDQPSTITASTEAASTSSQDADIEKPKESDQAPTITASTEETDAELPKESDQLPTIIVSTETPTSSQDADVEQTKESNQPSTITTSTETSTSSEDAEVEQPKESDQPTTITASAETSTSSQETDVELPKESDQLPAIIVSTEASAPSQDTSTEIPKELKIDGNAGFDPHRDSNEPEVVKTYLWHGKRYQVQGNEPAEWLKDVKEVPLNSSSAKGTERSQRRQDRISKTPTSSPSNKSSRTRRSPQEGSSKPATGPRRRSGRVTRSAAATQRVTEDDGGQNNE